MRMTVWAISSGSYSPILLKARLKAAGARVSRSTSTAAVEVEVVLVDYFSEYLARLKLTFSITTSKQ